MQSLDTVALVLCLLNMALQTIGMLWLLAECVRLAHLRALAGLPVRAASGLSRAWRSWRKGSRRDRECRQEKEWQKEEQPKEQEEVWREEQQQAEEQQADEDVCEKAKQTQPVLSLDTQCDGACLGCSMPAIATCSYCVNLDALPAIQCRCHLRLPSMSVCA
jgi:hypothetical protein